MNLNSNKYERLSLSSKHPKHPPLNRLNPAALFGSNIQIQFSNPEASDVDRLATFRDWRGGLRTSQKFGSISVVEYQKAGKAIQLASSCVSKKAQFGYPNRKGIQQLNRRSLQGSEAEKARKVKQLRALKNRIVNLPSKSQAYYSSNRRLSEVIQQLTSSTLVSPKEKKAYDFRMKLKRPQLMKKQIKEKIERFGARNSKTQSSSPEAFVECTQNLSEIQRPLTMNKTRKQRSFLRTKIKIEAQTLGLQTIQSFEIQPWNIDL